MPGTKAGGLETARKNKESDPDFYKKIGAIGGRNGKGYKFGHGKVDPAAIGAIGGKISKRPKANKETK